jgi:hypothetical protein
VRAIRKGWLKVGKRRPRAEQPVYLMWGDDDQVRRVVSVCHFHSVMC